MANNRLPELKIIFEDKTDLKNITPSLITAISLTESSMYGEKYNLIFTPSKLKDGN